MSACPENPHQPLICCQSCTGLYRGNSFQSYCPQSYCPQCYYRSFCQHPVHSPEEFAKFSDCTPKLDWCEQYFDECGEKNTAKKTTGDEKRQTGKPGTGAKKRTKKQKTDDGKKQTVGADNGANGSGRQITKDGSEQNGKTDLGANRSGRQSTEERYGQNAKRSIGTIRKGTLPTGDGNMQNDRLDNGPNRKGREPEGDGNKKSGKLGIGANKMGTQGNEPKRTEKKKTGDKNGPSNGDNGPTGQPPAPWPPQQGFPVHGMAPGTQGMHAIGPGIQGMQGMAPGSQGMQGMAPGTQGIQGMAAGTQYMQGMAPGSQGMQGMAPVSQFGVYGEQGGLPTPGAQVAVTGNEIGPTGMFANGANGPTGQPPAAWPPQEGFSLHGMPPGTQGMHGMAPLTQGMQGLAPGTQGMHGIAPGAQGIQGMATGSQGMHGMAPETHGIQGMAPGSQFRVYGEQEVHKQIPRYKDPGSMAIGYPPQLYQAPGGGPQDLLRYGQQALQANETYGRGEAQSAQSRKSQEKTGEDCEQSNPSSDAIHRVLQSLQLSFPENGLQNCCLLLPVNLDTANRIDEGDSKNGKELSLKRKLSKRDADSKKATSGGTPISKASMPASANTANGCSDCSPVVFPEQSMPSFCWNNSFFIQADECAQTGSSKPRKNSKELPPAVQCEPAPEEAPISSGFNTCCNAYCDSSYWPFYYYYDPCIGCYCWYPNPNYCNGQNCCPLNPLEKISEKPQHKEAPPVPAAAAPKKKKKIVRKKGGGPEQRSCNLGCTIPKCQTAAVSRDMRQAIIPRPHPVVAPLMGRLDWPTEFLDPSVG
ncbi:uncharacterized protein [Drosophila pseudoobscura]|uniref:Uncharacterized protein isoform X2 n=1 Tax=Drosophila pseudoobscura pseudoobscura TaxID=46245 RepID=A0A6I8W586_DROPS|nr:uncharacterized protein LOC6901829 isoform X2 [Drosophila pseudoobscura]